MKKPKKKPTKSVDWRTILATGLVDLIVGTALLLISKSSLALSKSSFA